MNEVISFRFKKNELNHIDKLSNLKRLDRTSAAKELIEYGWIYFIIQQYKNGKLSLGKTAKELQISLSELIDLLAEFGIKSPITFEDYLEGLKNV